MKEIFDSLRDLLAVVFEFATKNNDMTSVGNTGLETFGTIIAGVVVFVLCEIAREIWLSPLQEYRSLKAEVSRTLIYYARYYANPIDVSHSLCDEYRLAADKIRTMAAKTYAYAEVVPLIRLGIPDPKKIAEAGRHLIGISNGFFASGNGDAITTGIRNTQSRDRIYELLKMKGKKALVKETEDGSNRK